MKKITAAGLGLLFITACGGGNTPASGGDKSASAGQSVYESQCMRCHGSNGKLGLSGAKDLTVTTLTPAEMQQVISDGANGGMMPSYKEVLNTDEIKAVAEYIETTLKH